LEEANISNDVEASAFMHGVLHFLHGCICKSFTSLPGIGSSIHTD
jgi:hypothetical protein